MFKLYVKIYSSMVIIYKDKNGLSMLKKNYRLYLLNYVRAKMYFAVII